MLKNSRFSWMFLWLLLATPAAAVDCSEIQHKAQAFTVCKIDMERETLRLFLNDPQTAKPLGSFNNVRKLLGQNKQTLSFAMNAGMYHADRRPVGLYVENGVEIAPTISTAGPGNFGMLPNGVFCIQKARADVVETKLFLERKPECTHASQSGPMLVIDGALHPRFLPDSTSRYIRNGVGTSEDGRDVWFAISEAPVTFHDFGTLFRDVLKTPQALYFDGNISRLYAPGIKRQDGGFPMGPIVGVVAPQQND